MGRGKGEGQIDNLGSTLPVNVVQLGRGGGGDGEGPTDNLGTRYIAMVTRLQSKKGGRGRWCW